MCSAARTPKISRTSFGVTHRVPPAGSMKWFENREGFDVDTASLSATIADRFRLAAAPSLFADTPSKAPIAFTRLCHDGQEHGQSMPVPQTDAFSFQVMLQPLLSWDACHPRGPVALPPARAGDVFLFDLTHNPMITHNTSFDMMRFNNTQSSLDDLALDRGLKRVKGMLGAENGVHDPVMHGLAISLAGVMDSPGEGGALFTEYLALAFHAHVIHAYGGAPNVAPAGSLAPWQLRRVCELMDAEMSTNPTVRTLAAECHLSSSHFSRAFRETTGLAPHQWLTRRRIERAREMLLVPDSDLVDIALACGFVDQSHFARVFARTEHDSPGRWRRTRLN